MFATFETEHPKRHLETLCHHFGKRVPVGCDATTGWVAFPFGRCSMSAEQDRLNLWASAENKERLDDVVNVMTSHLERFAFRENPTLNWQPFKT